MKKARFTETQIVNILGGVDKTTLQEPLMILPLTSNLTAFATLLKPNKNGNARQPSLMYLKYLAIIFLLAT